MYSKVIAMKNKNSFLALALSLLVYGIPASADVGAIAGSNIFRLVQVRRVILQLTKSSVPPR